MTNKTELCKCGHEKSGHRKDATFLIPAYFECKAKNCPCKKFEPQSQEVTENKADSRADFIKEKPDTLRGKTPTNTTQEGFIKRWFEGFKEGELSVLEFLKDMKGLDFETEYQSWANADEYVKLNGEVIKRYD